MNSNIYVDKITYLFYGEITSRYRLLIIYLFSLNVKDHQNLITNFIKKILSVTRNAAMLFKFFSGYQPNWYFYTSWTLHQKQSCYQKNLQISKKLCTVFHCNKVKWGIFEEESKRSFSQSETTTGYVGHVLCKIKLK